MSQEEIGAFAPEKKGATAPSAPPEGPKRARGRLFWGAGVGGGVLLLAGGILAAVLAGQSSPASAPSSASPSANPERTSDPTPTATPTPEPTGSMPERYEFGLTQADVQGLIDMPLEQFAALPIGDRLPLGLYYLQDLPAFAESFYSVSKNPLDIGLPAAIDATNSIEQAWAQIANIRRLAVTLKKPDGLYIDPIAAKKLILTTIADPGSPAYAGYVGYIDDHDIDPGGDPNAQTLAASGNIAFPISFDLHSDLFTAADGLACYDAVVTERLKTMEKVEVSAQICLVGEPGRQLWIVRT